MICQTCIPAIAGEAENTSAADDQTQEEVVHSSIVVGQMDDEEEEDTMDAGTDQEADPDADPEAASDTDPENDPDSEPETEEEEEYIKYYEIDFPSSGEQYALLSCDRIGMYVNVYWDDADYILDWGAGTSMAGYLPGFGEPIILSGHNLTYFNPLISCVVGDIFRLDTDYGVYEYEVADIIVYDENDLLQLFYKLLGFDENGEKITEEETETSEQQKAETSQDDPSSDNTAPEEQNSDTDEAEPELGAAAEPEQDAENPASEETIEEASEEDAPEDAYEAADTEAADEEETAANAASEEDDPEKLYEGDTLIMYTCYPFYYIGTRKTQRYTIIAKRISGLDVHWRNPEDYIEPETETETEIENQETEDQEVGE